MEHTIQMLPVADLRPMENYRKSMDEKKLAELTESVKARGVIQPILCRKGHNTIGYEIIFGQRRWIAAKRAGLAAIPSMVRDVSDAEALELQIIENSQKEDPNPMEEGLGFKKLLDLGKHNVDTLAAKLDKSMDYVLGRIKLTSLPKEAQDKMLSGEIGIGHALQLTRLRNDQDIAEMVEEIIDEDLSISELKHRLRTFSTEMGKALFDTVGCRQCGSRTRTQAVLFPEAAKEKDACMDRTCFLAKTKGHYAELVEPLTELGVIVCTTQAAFSAAVKKASGREITESKQDYYHSGPHPREWKTTCKKCGKRAFGYWDAKNWQGPTIESKWACLDTKCLNKMNKIAADPPEQKRTSSGPSIASTQAALDCRNRFLYRELPPRIAQSRTLQLRLAIHHLLERFEELYGENPDESLSPDKARDDIFKKLTGKKYDWTDNYVAIAALPDGVRLIDALLEIALATAPFTEPEILLQMTPEAGIDLAKAALVDKPYLESKPAPELQKLAQALKLNVAFTGPNAKDAPTKAQVIDRILAQDLAGKLPKDIIDRCDLKTLAGMKHTKAPKAGAKKKGK